MVLALAIAYTDVEILNECLDKYCRVTICQANKFKRKPVLSGLNQVITYTIIVEKIFEWLFLIKFSC